MIFTQYNTAIKYVRSDNAPKLEFYDFFRSKGIVSFHSCVETPKQNSVVERKHQHILKVARALLFQSNVPLCYWGECVLTTIYLINRTPLPLLSNKSPFELLNNKKPIYSHLHSFACLCYGATLVSQRTKFTPRAKASVFLGYPFGYKGYKLLYLRATKGTSLDMLSFMKISFHLLSPNLIMNILISLLILSYLVLLSPFLCILLTKISQLLLYMNLLMLTKTKIYNLHLVHFV